MMEQNKDVKKEIIWWSKTGTCKANQCDKTIMFLPSKKMCCILFSTRSSLHQRPATLSSSNEGFGCKRFGRIVKYNQSSELQICRFDRKNYKQSFCQLLNYQLLKTKLLLSVFILCDGLPLTL